MAKEVRVSIIVDDDGSMRLTEKSAQKLGANLDKVGKSAVTADRQLKGVAQASANGAKNFAKQAQGISNGIVPVYAALAAQIFALGAAFRFLQDAGDLASLREGQVAYASATGVALGSLTDKIIKATNAQINFRDAAQAAAIGTASGLSPSQLEKLGTAAKDVSIILGRDVTDSFNRLVRGVTKAEPELLDELGIVLRLKDATEEYARALGKNANDLNAFERSQAVVNDVLKQTNDKYSRIVEITKPATNAFNQFGKAFDDIINGIKKGANFLLAPLAKLAAMNPFGTLLLAAPILSSLFRSMVPQVDSFFGSINTGLDNFSKKLDRANSSLNIDLTQLGALKGDLGAANALADQASENILRLGKETGVSAYGFKKLEKDGRLSLKTIDLNIKNASQGLYEYKGLTQETRDAFVDNFKDMRTSIIALEGDTKLSVAKTTSFWKLKWIEVQQATLGVLQRITTAVQKFANFFVKTITKIASVVGLLSIAFDLLPEGIKNAVKSFLGMEIIDDKLKSLRESLAKNNEEFQKFIQVQKIYGENANKIYEVSLARVNAFGEMVRSQELEDEITIIKAYNARVNDVKDDLVNIAENYRKLKEVAGEAWDWMTGKSADPKLFKVIKNTVGEAQTVLAEYINQRFNSIKALRLEGAAVAKYRLSLQDLNETLMWGQVISEEQIKAYEKSRKEFEALVATSKGYSESLESIEPKIKDAFKSILQISPLQELSDEFTKIDKIIFEINRNSKGFIEFTEQGYQLVQNMSKAEKEILITKLTEIDILERQLGIEQAIQLVRTGSEIKFLQLSKGATKEQLRQLNIGKQISSLTFDMIMQEEILQNAIRKKVVEGENLTQQELNQLAIQQRNIDLLQEQINKLEEQEARAYKLGMALKQGLEDGLQTNIYDLITGDEASFKDAVLKTVKVSLESAAKELSTQLTNDIIGGLFGKKETADEKRNRELFETFETGAEVVKNKILAAFAEAKDSYGQFKTDPLSSTYGTPELREKAAMLKGQPVSEVAGRSVASLSRAAEDAKALTEQKKDGQTRETALYVIPVDPLTTGPGILAKPGPLSTGEDPLGLKNKELGRLEWLKPLKGDGLGVKSAKAPEELIYKKNDKNAVATVESLNRVEKILQGDGEGLETHSPSLIQSIGGLLQGVLSPILGGSSSSASAIGSFFAGMFGAASGGIMPGGVTGYANGGIVKRPTLGLVGEGKMNEAVVPLPDGKAIPVNMNGNANTNNVTVNVSMDKAGNAETKSESDGQMASMMGKLIAGAVQEELQRQKRPGGILSPYGAA